MTIAYKTNARWFCQHFSREQSHIASDGDEGPDDGSGHVHPEHVFSQDLHSSGFPGLHLH